MVDFRAGAVISACERYRYRLWHILHPSNGSRVLFVMLNPSTADGVKDDPTIRRCIGFAQDWGFGRLDVANLFAFRATKPADLAKADDPVGPENDAYLIELGALADRIVFAWGTRGTLQGRDQQVGDMFGRRGLHAWCLGKTKAKHPRHPLYVPRDASLVPAINWIVRRDSPWSV